MVASLLQAENPGAMDHGNDRHRAPGVTVDDAVVAEDQLAVGLSRILRHQATRFRECLQLREALVQAESERPSRRLARQS